MSPILALKLHQRLLILDGRGSVQRIRPAVEAYRSDRPDPVWRGPRPQRPAQAKPEPNA